MTEIWNAVVESTFLGFEDHGILTGFVHVRGGGHGGGFGGWNLGGPAAGAWLRNVLKTLDIEKWEDLPGTPCRIESNGTGSTLERIGHFTEDKWFSPREVLERLVNP